MRFTALLTLPLLLSGCIVGTVAKTAVDVVTLPVKAASAGVDAVTTSQEEADRNRGRAMRKAEEDYGRRLREWQKACARAQADGRPCEPQPTFTPLRN